MFARGNFCLYNPIMRIGIDCRMYSSTFTGIGRYTHELVQQFIKLNKKHELVLFFNNPEYSKFTIPKTLPKTLPKNIKKVLVNAKHYSFSEQTKFLKILYKEKLNIMHFTHFNVPIFYRRPYIVTIHDLTLSLFPGQKMTKWYHRLAYNLTIKNATKTAKKIIAVSKNTKIDLMHYLKIPAKKIEVIYNGINPNFKFIKNPNLFKNTLKKFNIAKQFLLYTGVWRSHKNIPRLIKAFYILKNAKNLKLQLVITGNSDSFYPEIKQTVKALHLQDDVIFPGLVAEKELVHLYNAAFIYVFPSLYEGFGFPPLEAMKCGTPVVASNTSSIPEICGRDNALFFNPYDIKDITEKIDMLYKNTDLQAKLINNGLTHAEKFSWEKTAKSTYDLILKNV